MEYLLEIKQFINQYMAQIETIYAEFKTFTKVNPVVGGMFGLWLMGVVTYCLKTVPFRIYHFIKRYVTVSVTLNSMNQSFHDLLSWYEKNKNLKTNRTMRVTNGKYGYEDTEISLGFGDHFFMHKFRPFIINRNILSADGGERPKEEITIKTIGFTQKALLNLIKDTIPDKEKEDRYIYEYRDGWDEKCELPKRTWDSVILKDGQKDKIIDFIEDFDNQKQWYNDMGISYKTGICFSGPPGTGKTSAVKALANKLEKNLCILNCSTIGDNSFAYALNSTPKNSIVLMEDFDSIKSTVNRENLSEEVSFLGVSLSTVLNGIDGIYSSEGRILIATTNRLETLDPALLRPGRFDLKEVIDYADSDMVIQMFNKFYPNFQIDDISINNEITLAQVENVFLKNKYNPEQSKIEVENLVKETYIKPKTIYHESHEEENVLDRIMKKGRKPKGIRR